VLADAGGERTIITAGHRWPPAASDDLGWDGLEGGAGVYLTAGGAAVFELARRARTLVAIPDATAGGLASGIILDALIFSANAPEEFETAHRLWVRSRSPPPRHACANVSGVRSTATSTSSVRRVKNTSTLSASRTYSARNASAVAIYA